MPDSSLQYRDNNRLTFEDGQIKLGPTLLPGIVVSLSVRGEVRFDKHKKDGLSGKRKVPLGWEDAAVTIVMDLLSDNESKCYAKLAALNALFKGADKKADPQIYTAAGSHLRARGIQKVIFSGLESSETDDIDVIRASLTFVEFQPLAVKRELRTVAKAGRTQAAPGTNSADFVEIPVDARGPR